MLHAFIFGPIAITVGYWVQRGVETESGARVEIRRVEHDDVPEAPAGVAGFCVLPVTQGIWRADLFRNQDDEIIYHFHPHFEKGDVGERYLDEALTADPVGWVITRLADLRRLLIDSGARDLVEQVDYPAVERSLPTVRRAIIDVSEP